MLKKNELESGYNDLINRYWDIYENDWYEVIFEYPVDKNHKKVNVTNPIEASPQFKMHIIEKERGRAMINASISEKGDPSLDITDGITIFHPDMHDRVYFEDVKETAGEYAEACQTIVEINNLIEELFPGYCITKKKASL